MTQWNRNDHAHAHVCKFAYRMLAVHQCLRSITSYRPKSYIIMLQLLNGVYNRNIATTCSIPSYTCALFTDRKLKNLISVKGTISLEIEPYIEINKLQTSKNAKRK